MMESVKQRECLTLQEIANFVVEKKAKCGCGYRFEQSDIGTYEHDYGIEVSGEERKQWVYFHCPRCHYDLALWKILDRIALLEDEQ